MGSKWTTEKYSFGIGVDHKRRRRGIVLISTTWGSLSTNKHLTILQEVFIGSAN